jgi:hypothetical protein
LVPAVSWRVAKGVAQVYRNDDYGFAVEVEVRDGVLVYIDLEDPSDCSTLVASDDSLVYTVATAT